MSKILATIKTLVGVGVEYTHFDGDLVVYINSAMLPLKQIGAGKPDTPLVIDENTEWDQLFEVDESLSAVTTYVKNSVRLKFDPPTSGYLIDAIREQMAEDIWRIREFIESKEVVTND